MRRIAIALLFVAFLLVGAGCGGGDDEAADDTVVTETTDDDLDTSDLDAFASEECLQLVSIGAALAQAFAGTGGAETEETSGLLDRLAGEAPDEIRDDIETLAAGYADYADAIRDLDLQEGEVPSAEQVAQIQAALASSDQPELTAASERLSAWAEENCPSG